VGFGVYPFLNASQFALNNSGEIYGGAGGIKVETSLGGGIVNNSGLIRSDVDGILVHTAAGLTTTIDNAAGGKITGFSTAIHADSGAISLNNRGTVDGAILCAGANANDLVLNTGKIAGEVFLGPGNDTFNGQGGTSGAIFGGGGDDILTGGKGHDDLTGDLGLDTFDFNKIKESPKGAARDVIHDFNHAEGDVIDLSTIDANALKQGNQAFHFIKAGAFHHNAGELRFAHGVLQGDVNGDGNADFEIGVANAAHLLKSDFHF
jgi:Ca2+-binding RTX toxin-like protein